jgi:hypothetical protein
MSVHLPRLQCKGGFTVQFTMRVCIHAGGVVVCCGEGCTATFTDVTFNNCTLLALQGAHVTLNQSKHQHSHAASSGLSIYTHGPGTKVAVRGGTISGGIQGASVHAGARLEAYGLNVSAVEVLGVEVCDVQSSLRLTDCKVHGFSSVYRDLDIMCGIFMHAGSKAELSSLDVQGPVYGLAVHGKAALRLSDSTVSGTVSHCVAMTLGATGRLDRCKFLRSKAGHGLFVEGEGSCLHVSQCRLSHNGSSGGSASNGGKLTAVCCKTAGNKVAGFSVQVSGVLNLSRCSSDGDACGCRLATGAKLHARKVAVRSSAQAGFVLESLGHMVLRECSARQCGTFGIEGKGTGSWLDAEDCAILECQAACVQLHSSARGKCKGCTMSHSVLSSGVVASGRSTHIVLEDCVMQQNAKCGAAGRDMSVIMISGCRSSRNRAHGYEAHSKAQLTVRQSSSDGDFGGFSVRRAGTIKLEEVTVDGVAKTGSFP